MKKCMISILMMTMIVSAAELTVERDASFFIDSVSNARASYLEEKELTSSFTGEATPLLEDSRMSKDNRISEDYRNIGYEVIKQRRDEKVLSRLNNCVVDGRDEVNEVRYDDRDGRYFFHRSFHAMRYSKESEATVLRTRAGEDLERLLGRDADYFVMANTETDWEQTRENPEPRILAMTFRFTRKINGRHIIDNTAYVRITYSGDDQLCGFEIVNPRLRPVRIPLMVKQNVIRERLNRFARNKTTARNSVDGEVTIERITAENGIQSYRAKKKGDKILLSPYISFFCRYDMETGATFQKFEHFSLDATRCENLDDSFLDIRR